MHEKEEAKAHEITTDHRAEAVTNMAKATRKKKNARAQNISAEKANNDNTTKTAKKTNAKKEAWGAEAMMTKAVTIAPATTPDTMPPDKTNGDVQDLMARLMDIVGPDHRSGLVTQADGRTAGQNQNKHQLMKLRLMTKLGGIIMPTPPK